MEPPKNDPSGKVDPTPDRYAGGKPSGYIPLRPTKKSSKGMIVLVIAVVMVMVLAVSLAAGCFKVMDSYSKGIKGSTRTKIFQ